MAGWEKMESYRGGHHGGLGKIKFRKLCTTYRWVLLDDNVIRPGNRMTNAMYYRGRLLDACYATEFVEPACARFCTVLSSQHDLEVC